VEILTLAEILKTLASYLGTEREAEIYGQCLMAAVGPVHKKAVADLREHWYRDRGRPVPKLAFPAV
jgi:hypothetical protein